MTSSSSRERYLAKGEGIKGSSILLGLVGALRPPQFTTSLGLSKLHHFIIVFIPFVV